MQKSDRVTLQPHQASDSEPEHGGRFGFSRGKQDLSVSRLKDDAGPLTGFRPQFVFDIKGVHMFPGVSVFS